MFSLSELQIIRAGLDVITIKGGDAQFVAQLQIKVEQQMHAAASPPKPEKTQERSK